MSVKILSEKLPVSKKLFSREPILTMTYTINSSPLLVRLSCYVFDYFECGQCMNTNDRIVWNLWSIWLHRRQQLDSYAVQTNIHKMDFTNIWF